jgi:predicted phosphate transport protein (TIGR00153 family)
MARLSFLPKEEQYFALLKQMTSYIYDAARGLVSLHSESGAGNYAAHARQIKTIEDSCDDLIHSIVMKLNKSFITPFDREDIYLMAGGLDDIVDLIDDSARAMVMYNVQESTQHARDFADVIQRMAVQLHEAVSALAKPADIGPRLVEIHRLENEGDDIFHTAIAELFRDTPDALTVLKWKEIYEKMEAAIDRCEHVANIIESVIIKHA